MNVLFVCRQNAGRSQMAQALYERRGGSARSAGTTPAALVHPEVSELMPELAGRVPHMLEREDAEWADLVVTMGCGDACPVIPASATSTGSWRTRPGRIPRPCARSATRSNGASATCRSDRVY